MWDETDSGEMQVMAPRITIAILVQYVGYAKTSCNLTQVECKIKMLLKLRPMTILALAAS